MDSDAAPVRFNGQFPPAPDEPTGDWRVDMGRPALGALASMVFRVIVDRLQVHLAERGFEPMRPALLYVLRALYPHPRSVSELAVRCEVSKQAVSQVVDSMEELGLVRRVPHPSDGRIRLVEISEEGERRFAAAILAYGDVEREWAELLGGAEAMSVVRQAMVALVETFGDWHLGEEPRLRPVW
ncbi:hypothetical protein Rruber_05198 (plasmid) [Rhodococcus ruber]|uniref:MarR family winged helix-turn-helix transcriptional regulator n=1 Tax=Rhodococcus ruber TaxID=1830 RepID=UPI00315D99FD